MKNQKGFTLVELMVVIAIIGILAAIAIPQFSVYRKRAFMSEGMVLAGPVIHNISDYYGHRGIFPLNNREGGVAEPDVLRGKYVRSIHIHEGRITILFNEEARSISGGTITLIPEVVEDDPSGIIFWKREDNFPEKSS